MKNNIEFNPSDFKYKQVSDLPEEEQKNFRDNKVSGEGFVRKTAWDLLRSARHEAKINEIHGAAIDFMDNPNAENEERVDGLERMDNREFLDRYESEVMALLHKMAIKEELMLQHLDMSPNKISEILEILEKKGDVFLREKRHNTLGGGNVRRGEEGSVRKKHEIAETLSGRYGELYARLIYAAISKYDIENIEYLDIYLVDWLLSEAYVVLKRDDEDESASEKVDWNEIQSRTHILYSQNGESEQTLTRQIYDAWEQNRKEEETEEYNKSLLETAEKSEYWTKLIPGDTERTIGELFTELVYTNNLYDDELRSWHTPETLYKKLLLEQEKKN